MSRAGYLVVGAGGHAKVVADALLAAGEQLLGFVDKGSTGGDAQLLGLPVFDQDRDLPKFDRAATRIALGIGTTRGGPASARRESFTNEFAAMGWRFSSVRHPGALIAHGARLGEGVQLLGGAIVQPDAVIGDGSIVNTAAVAEHDAIIGRFCHISIGTILCGNVRVGDFSHVGAGAVVREGVTIGPGVTIGIGAVVVADCDSDFVYYGNPARRMEQA